MCAFVRTASLTGYEELGRSLGLDPARLMAAEGLDITDLAQPDTWVPATPVARLLELSARESGHDDFAVRLSYFRRLGTLGPLSVALREETDLRSVLDLLIRYEHLYTGVLDLRMTEEDGLATVAIWLEFGEPAPARQAHDLIAANVVGIIRMLIRADWLPIRAYFSHPAPRDPTEFRRTFGHRLQFDHEFTGLVFDARDLDAAVVTSDVSVRPYARMFLDNLVAPSATTARGRVDEVLEVLLPLGRTSLSEVSRYVGFGPRGLQQRLAAEGQTFSSVMHTTRARLAERHLADEHVTLTEVSLLLGFAAPSTFTRWFRQQFGTTPSEWRALSRLGAIQPDLDPAAGSPALMVEGLARPQHRGPDSDPVPPAG